MAKFTNCLQIVNAMPEQDQDALLARLDELQARGMSPKEAQLQAAIDVLAQVEREGQARKSTEREANFKRWARNLEVIPAELADIYDGGPAVFQVYHGTTHTDITEFKNIGSKEGALGQGPYFSTSAADVNENYAGVGPDLTNRIGREIDNVAQGFDDDAWNATDILQAYFDDNGINTEITDDNIEELKDEYRDKAIEHAATKALKGDSDGLVMPAYVRLEKPFNMATNPTMFELAYPQDADGENDYDAEPEGSAVDLVNAIETVAGGYNADASSLTGWVYENGADGVSAREVWDRAAKDISDLYDDDGEMISSGQFMQEVAREMGFDGLIQDADLYFGTQRRGFGGIRAGAMKGVNPGTLHIMPFDGKQVKSATGNNGEFGENREILKSAERMARTPEFQKWFGDSLVVDAAGNPMVVYRGEHGADGGIDFQSRLASLSFGTRDVANAYAGEPNDSADRAEAPRLYPVYLRIENPLVNDPSDPFIELGDVANKLGQDVAEAAARKFAAEIEETDNWDENFADQYDSVDELLDERPEAVRELYTLAWRFFDMPEFVNAAKKAGYDGAIHAEYGTHSEQEEGAEYKVFDQGQVKSAIGNNGDYSDSRDITKSVARPQFYSQLQRAIDGVPDRIATMAAPQWKLWLDSNGPKQGVKKDEIEWSGIKDYLDLQGKAKLSKDDLASYLDDSGAKVGETMLGRAYNSDGSEKWDYKGEAKYGQYTLPGGENYRELLITLDGGVSGKELAALDERIQELEDDRDGAEYDERDAIDQRIFAVQAERKALLGNGYRSSHWDEPNVLAHIRVNDRTDADGKRVLFVEEVQSDWGQTAKKEGTGDTLKTGWKIVEQEPGFFHLKEDGYSLPRAFGTKDAVMKAADRMGALMKGVPAAPFITKTEGWLNLALKRIAMMAVEGGYDKVAFVNGEQSADRYDLSKQIQSIAYSPEEKFLDAWDKDRRKVMRREITDESQLEDYVGKEVAKRLLATKPVMGKHLLDGEDIKVGGEGMKSFYDQIVPQALNKLLPKIGGEKLGTVDIGSMDTKQGREGDALLAELGVEVKGKRPPAQPGFDVTDKMRETVGAGVPLFSRDRKQTETPAFKAWFGDSKVVDADGNPLVVYHGSVAKGVTEFDTSRVTARTSKGDTPGTYFTSDPKAAYNYTREFGAKAGTPRGEVVPAYLKIENPLNTTADIKRLRKQGLSFGDAKRKALESLTPENDGIIFDGDGVNAPEFVVFKPTQIKSATGNDGGFDPSKKDITKSRDRKAPDTKEFKAWFGDSKVVNAKGEPLVVYHGTAADITEFDPEKVGTRHVDVMRDLSGADLDPTAFYFTDDSRTADWYAKSASKQAKAAAMFCLSTCRCRTHLKSISKARGLSSWPRSSSEQKRVATTG